MYSNTKCLNKLCFFSSSSNKFEGYGCLFVFHVIFQQFYGPEITVSMARTSNGTQVRKVNGSMFQALYLILTTGAGVRLVCVHNSVVLVLKRTIPTERPQPVVEVSANFS
jgi:hypothetical protein